MSGAVVLLHGMGRTRYSMRRAGRRLRDLGWDTRLIGYPSLTRPIEILARHVADRVQDNGVKLHFVTHSLGGLVLRRLLHAHRPADVGRVVMLAPPNRGSELARTFAALGQVVPAIRQMALPEAELETLLGPIDFDVLIVAGSRAAGPLRWLTGAANDGLVTVEETVANAAPEPLVVRRGHTRIMDSWEVLEAVDRFLRTGRAR